MRANAAFSGTWFVVFSGMRARENRESAYDQKPSASRLFSNTDVGNHLDVAAKSSCYYLSRFSSHFLWNSFGWNYEVWEIFGRALYIGDTRYGRTDHPRDHTHAVHREIERAVRFLASCPATRHIHVTRHDRYRWIPLNSRVHGAPARHALMRSRTRWILFSRMDGEPPTAPCYFRPSIPVWVIRMLRIATRKLFAVPLPPLT